MVYGMVFLPMTAEDCICSGIKEVNYYIIMSLFFLWLW
jgi:hypothetical protein